MTLEQKPTREQLVTSDISLQIGSQAILIANLKAEIAELKNQLEDASDRA